MSGGPLQAQAVMGGSSAYQVHLPGCNESWAMCALSQKTDINPGSPPFGLHSPSATHPCAAFIADVVDLQTLLFVCSGSNLCDGENL